MGLWKNGNTEMGMGLWIDGLYFQFGAQHMVGGANEAILSRRNRQKFGWLARRSINCVLVTSEEAPGVGAWEAFSPAMSPPGGGCSVE